MKKIIIANRGEIAVRVIRTAREQGYRSVAVYSEADAGALHTSMADEAVCIGPAPVAESYLSIDAVIAAAKLTNADAVHPGYGFLSENAEFAKACDEAGLIFIGPSPDAIELMGSKRLSKLAMERAKVPCVPGYSGSDQTDGVFAFEAEKIGFPLMVKASAGGGGRGMRLVERKEDLLASIETARSEAMNAFGSSELILEKAIVEPRHIEVQIFGDSHGNIVHLFERDCSIQRRHQKVVEEAPSPFMTDELRLRMGQAAVKAAKACDYVGAGTVEFLVDKDRNFYFLEMNTRLQVEHPVTEMVTGVDLVAWQLSVAEGQPLPLAQDDIRLQGHAIEVRLYAEDPANGFLPQTGTVLGWKTPVSDGVRTDHGLQSGQAVSAFYDPMLAKLIAYGPSRGVALRRLRSALQDTTLLGVTHNRAFLSEIVGHDAFENDSVTTAFLEQYFGEGTVDNSVSLELARAALVLFHSTPMAGGDWTSASGQTSQFLFDVTGDRLPVSIVKRGQRNTVVVADQEIEIELLSMSNEACVVIENGVRTSFAFVVNDQTVYLDGSAGHLAVKNVAGEPAVASAGKGDGSVRAPMDGAIVDVKAAVGDIVAKGDILVVMEAMKMEHSLKASVAGIVSDLSAKVGDQVKSKQVLANVDVQAGEKQ